MNQEQRRYFLKRLSEIEQEKIDIIEEKHTKLEKEISPQERLFLIKTGKVKLKSSVKGIDDYDEVKDLYDFSEFEWPEKTDKKAFNLEVKKLSKKFSAAKDKLMVFEASDAIKLMQELE